MYSLCDDYKVVKDFDSFLEVNSDSKHTKIDNIDELFSILKKDRKRKVFIECSNIHYPKKNSFITIVGTITELYYLKDTHQTGKTYNSNEFSILVTNWDSNHDFYTEYSVGDNVNSFKNLRKYIDDNFKDIYNIYIL